MPFITGVALTPRAWPSWCPDCMPVVLSQVSPLSLRETQGYQPCTVAEITILLPAQDKPSQLDFADSQRAHVSLVSPSTLQPPTDFCGCLPHSAKASQESCHANFHPITARTRTSEASV